MGTLFVSAAVAAALNHGIAIEEPAQANAQCIVETALPVDSLAGPLLVSLPDSPPGFTRAPAAEGQWGQSALRPYDVMSSLGAGVVPAMPQSLTLADAPAALPVASPMAWVLAGAGLLGMLYLRRTRA